MAPIDVTAVELATAIGGSVDTNGNTVALVHPILAGVRFGEQQVVFRVNEGLLEFCASAVAVSIREDVVQHREPNPRKGPLLDFKLDFARWAERPSESLETQFVQKLETSFDRWQFAEFTSRVVEQGRGSIAQQAFPSFVDRLQIDQDLKIEAQVRTADCVLVADCEIGTDLHKFYVARTLLLAARALPLVRPDRQSQK